jgi:hypothetical protein
MNDDVTKEGGGNAANILGPALPKEGEAVVSEATKHVGASGITAGRNEFSIDDVLNEIAAEGQDGITELGSWGAVFQEVQKVFPRQVISGTDRFLPGIEVALSDDEPFLLTGGFAQATQGPQDIMFDLDGGNKVKFVIAMSTRNMLWNIQRSMVANNGHLHLSLGTSHRYRSQGVGLLVVSTVDRTGSDHKIAFALLSTEDAASIQFAVSAMKVNFERLVEWLHSRNVTEF